MADNPAATEGGPVTRLAVLASGSGTNFDAIADAVADGTIPAEICLLLCNRPEAKVLAKAANRGIPTACIDHKGFPDRATFDSAVADALEESRPDYVAMAGFDRIVTNSLLSRFPDRTVNIHPALLPAFRGADAQQQAADYGVAITGATVHFVDDKVDHGPIIAQAAVCVQPGEDASTIRQRILQQEHRLYPHALRLLAEGRVSIEGRFVRIRGTAAVDGEALLSPEISPAGDTD